MQLKSEMKSSKAIHGFESGKAQFVSNPLSSTQLVYVVVQHNGDMIGWCLVIHETFSRLKHELSAPADEFGRPPVCCCSSQPWRH